MSLSSRDCPLVTETNVPLMARRSYPALALGCPWAASISFFRRGQPWRQARPPRCTHHGVMYSFLPVFSGPSNPQIMEPGRIRRRCRTPESVAVDVVESDLGQAKDRISVCVDGPVNWEFSW